MNVAFVCYFSDGRISGPSRSVVSLANALEKCGGDVVCKVYTSCSSQDRFVLHGRNVYPLRDLFCEDQDYDVVVLAGIYNKNIWKIGRFLRGKGIPYVVSPRSNLMRLSLRKGFVKKVLAHLTFSRHLINGARLLHFLSSEEKKNSFDYGRPYFISRNGVLLNAFDCSEIVRPRVISFVGRIDIHHKGLDVCLRAISDNADLARRLGWSFCFYGPATNKADIHFMKMLDGFGLHDIVTLEGPVEGKEKSVALSRSRFFLHTSRYEGQPQAVLEAMACGVVPILTEGTNLKVLIKRYNAGWCVPFSQQEISSALAEALMLDDWSQLSSNAVKCIKEEFSWTVAADEFLSGLKMI